jgi:hypothetical protein
MLVRVNGGGAPTKGFVSQKKKKKKKKFKIKIDIF